MVRAPVVAGQFYPENPSALRAEVTRLLGPAKDAVPALGVIAPHAGYVYSGAIAGKTLAGIHLSEQILCLGPNHHGHGQRAAVFAQGEWKTPLGSIAIAEALAAELLQSVPGLAEDYQAHLPEHSLEVLMPFLQVRAPQARIVPLCLAQAPLDQLLTIGEGIGRVLQRQAAPVLMLCSSDMNHFEADTISRKKDQRAIDRILALDAEGLYHTVREGRISMCGVVPAVVMLAAARVLGARAASLVEYDNSGAVSGDQSSVVGYAGIVVR